MNLQINETISVHLSITTYKTVNTKPGVSKVWAQGQTGSDVNCAMVSMLEWPVHNRQPTSQHAAVFPVTRQWQQTVLTHLTIMQEAFFPLWLHLQINLQHDI